MPMILPKQIRKREMGRTTFATGRVTSGPVPNAKLGCNRNPSMQMHGHRRYR